MNKFFLRQLLPQLLLAGFAVINALTALAAEPGWPEPIEDNLPLGMIITDQLEYRANQGADTLRWDIQGRYGTDVNKLWVKFEGDSEASANTGELEIQTLYSRMMAPFWDLQVGIRHDRFYGVGPTTDRSFAVLGVQGLAPYRFELEPAVFISEDGDFSARLTGTYEMLFSQRLILQPRFEINIAASTVRAFGVGSGFNDVQLGLRLRYELRREFAPYVGLTWLRELGNTAELTRDNGGNIDNLAFMVGLRMWY